MSTNKVPIVIENGTGVIKAGFSGTDKPIELNSYVVSPKNDMVERGMKQNETYVRKMPLKELSQFYIRHPSRYGVVDDWDDMEKIWHYIFHDELKINPEEHPVLVTEALKNPKFNRKFIAEILFETFKSPAIYIGIQDVLSMYASGRTSGVVCKCGEGVLSTMCIFDGYLYRSSCQRTINAGCTLTDYLAKLLTERGLYLTTSAEREFVRDIKEKHCYVARDFEAECGKPAESFEQTFELPDGERITIGDERFRCPEALFTPALRDVESCGIHEITYNSIFKCDIDARQRLFENVILSGGTTMLPGFRERLEIELAALAPADTKIKVFENPVGTSMEWIGGSIISCMPTFQKSCISKQDFDEHGPNIIYKKCM